MDSEFRTGESSSKSDLFFESYPATGAVVGVGAFVITSLSEFIRISLAGEELNLSLTDFLIVYIWNYGFVEMDVDQGVLVGFPIQQSEYNSLLFLTNWFFYGFVLVGLTYIVVARVPIIKENIREFIAGVAAGHAIIMYLVAASFEPQIDERVMEQLFGGIEISGEVLVSADPVTALIAGALFGLISSYIGIILSERQRVFKIITVIWVLFILATWLTTIVIA